MLFYLVVCPDYPLQSGSGGLKTIFQINNIYRIYVVINMFITFFCWSIICLVLKMSHTVSKSSWRLEFCDFVSQRSGKIWLTGKKQTYFCLLNIQIDKISSSHWMMSGFGLQPWFQGGPHLQISRDFTSFTGFISVPCCHGECSFTQ